MHYYPLPMLFSSRLFEVFSSKNSKILTQTDFVLGMRTLFCSDFEKTSKLIFDFYDFNDDGFITREDIIFVFSYYLDYSKRNQYYPVTFDKEKKVDEFFGKSQKFNFKQFIRSTQTVDSDILIILLFLLLDHKPFSHLLLNEYQNIIYNVQRKKDVTSPDFVLQAGPSLFVSENLFREKKYQEGMSFAFSFSKALEEQEPEFGEEANACNSPVKVNRIPVSKEKTNLNQIVNKSSKIKKEKTEDEKVIPVYEVIKFSLQNQDEEDFSTSERTNSDDFDEFDDFREGHENVTNYEGWLYKALDHKYKKLWFKLFDKDFFYFKNKTDIEHKGMHNLSGGFVRENKIEFVNGKNLYSFSIITQKKERVYFVKDESEYKTWVSTLKKVLDNRNINDFYEVKQTIGKGHFGLVKEGLKKFSNKKVAIKIMAKDQMSASDFELVKTEIEILKICDHPNIVKFYDYFEDEKSLYIVMEYCQGGELFDYAEKRRFKLGEKRVSKIIKDLSSALKYLHSFNIIHRDIKPENVLMTSIEDDAEIRIVDFGLSKILYPGNECTEPYGTISYIAPEILLKLPYSEAVDVWALGVTCFLLLGGYLPFDDINEKNEIVVDTLIEKPLFDDPVWNSVSKEGKNFIQKMLIKDPSKRMTLKDLFKHKWISKYL